jgi:putative tryptophan/tyrosine transport system substrate-binding protein
MNRRDTVLGLLALGIAPRVSFAQQRIKTWRIGFLAVGTASFMASRVGRLRAGLRELDYVEGKNTVVELRYADGKNERLAELAAELARIQVDVLVTHTTLGVQACKQATSTIPIVIAATADPVATGLVASLARPGGNVTGSAIFTPEIMAKRIELLKSIAPHIKRVAAYLRPSASSIPIIQAMETAARALKVEVQIFDAPSVNELNSSFLAMVKKGVNGLIAQDDPVIIANAKAIAGHAEKHRIPSAGNTEFAEAGNLLAYGVDIPEMFYRAAYFVDKIAKGARPSDLPVEQPTRFELIVNLKTGKALGIKIPQSLLLRADRVIE